MAQLLLYGMSLEKMEYKREVVICDCELQKNLVFEFFSMQMIFTQLSFSIK
jgi:hypothetical protein